MSSRLTQLFPPPKFLSMPSVGVDISDTSVKFVELMHGKSGIEVGRFGSHKIPEGVVVSGKVKDSEGLVAALKDLKQEYGLHFVRASLPEEQGYLFETEIPADADDVRTAIEFVLEENVPLSPGEAVVGYDVVKKKGKRRSRDRQAVVSVFPGSIAESYTTLLQQAGLVPLSLEIEPQAIARAVLRPDETGSTCIVDFGRGRSGIAMTSGQYVKFASTISAGGDDVSKVIQTLAPEASAEEVENIKNEKGVSFLRTGGIDGLAPLNALVAELTRYITYWNTLDATTEGKQEKITKIILCGGNANIAGLPEFVSKELQVSCERANVWTNILDINTVTPPIFFRDSLGFAPAIGLALRSVSGTDPLFFS